MSNLIGERSLQECKDQVAMKHFSVPYDKLLILGSQIKVLHEAAELYASQFKPKSSTLQDVLKAFCEFLETNGYMDSDWRDELPSAIDRFQQEQK